MPGRESQRAQHRAGRRGNRRGRVGRGQLIAVSIVAVLGVAIIVWIGGSAGGRPLSSSAASGTPGPVARSEHVRGEASAPVTMEEWADFQCPACGMFARQTEPQLLSSYVAKGQVRLVFHHMAFLGPESSWAAEASECANEQGKFWEYHDKLFASQVGENRGAFSKANLKRFGEELGLGPGFAVCVDSDRYARAVRDDTRAGQDRGVSATPTFFINGRKVEGALTFDQLKAIIDPLLAGR